MRFLHLATHDTRGGAAQAAYRLHALLRGRGHASRMLVASKSSHDADVHEVPVSKARYRAQSLCRRLPGWPARRFKPSYHAFNLDAPTLVDRTALLAAVGERPDVVCLHWVTSFLNVRDIARLHAHIGAPLLWWLADEEPITGGCHCTFGCERFKQGCGCCPQLHPSHAHDRSRTVWERKRRWLTPLPILFWGGGARLLQKVRDSGLFGGHRVRQVFPGFDETVFRPIDRRVARDLLHLPQERKIVFFGATMLDDPRKGMEPLLKALAQLRTLLPGAGLGGDEVFLAYAGLQGAELASRLPFAGRYLGLLRDSLTLALAYQAADTFVCPSIGDEGPMMIPEALLCGTPVVAFPTGYALDLVRTGETGYLCGREDAGELARGLLSVLTAPNAAALAANAREVAVARHAEQTFVDRFLDMCLDAGAAPGGRAGAEVRG